jgi:iron complex outermembrane recepter protein
MLKIYLPTILLFLLTSSSSLFSQKNTPITGIIIAENSGESVIGATIRSQKTPLTGTTTDVDGKFSITTLPDDTLLVSYIGFESIAIPVAGRTFLEIKLSENGQTLGETVITAFGIERQARAVGFATQNVKGDELSKSNTANILGGLAGKMAGVNIVQGNGVEGGTTRIVIRGNTQIFGNNQPLIIVDGVPLDNSPGWTGVESGRDWGSAINNINSADIERLDVLKGANAAALYGARGGNGVILITTKKGIERPGLGIDYQYSMRTTNPFYWREMQNEYGFGGPFSFNEPRLATDADGVYQHPAELYTDFGPEGKPTTETFGAYASSQSWGPRLDGTPVRWWDGSMRSWSPQPDNFKRFFQRGLTQRHNLSFSGASKMGSVRASFTREDHRSVALNSNFDQTTAFIGSKLNVSKKVRAEIGISYIQYNRLNSPILGSDNNSFGKIMIYGYPRSYQGENLNYEEPNGTKHDFGPNPFAWGNIDVFWSVYNQNTWLRRNKIIGSAAIFYDIAPWLTLMGRTGTDNTFDDFESKNKPIDITGTLGGGYSHSLSKANTINNEFLLSAKRKNILPNLETSLNFGGTQYQIKTYSLFGSNYSQWRDPFLYSLGNFVGYPTTPTEGRYEKRLNSLYSFLDLGYKNWLFGQVSVRNDWSSTLPKATGSYLFPAANVSFVPSELLDWQKSPYVNFAKIRFAYSETATDDDPYQLQRVYTTGNFAGQPTAFPEPIVRPLDLRPQRSQGFEIGLNIGALRDRMQIDFTYYYINSYNQLLNSPLPSSSGYPTVRINTGAISNRGMEAIVGMRWLERKHFSWETKVNGARNRNRLEKLSDGAELLELGGIWGANGSAVSVKAQQAYGVMIGFDYVRDEASGLPILNEAGTQYQVTKVRVPLKIYDEQGKFKRYANSAPKFIGGIRNIFTWKNFSAEVLVDAKIGGDMYSGSYATAQQSGQSPNTLIERNGGGLPYTRPDGTVANIGVVLPGVYADGTPNDKVVHYYYKYLNSGGWGPVLTTPSVFENTWVKLREVSISYRLPKKWGGKVFQNLQIALVGRDLAYLYSSLPDKINPEGANGSGNAQGIEFGALPGMRSFGLTLGAGF